MRDKDDKIKKGVIKYDLYMAETWITISPGAFSDIEERPPTSTRVRHGHPVGLGYVDSDNPDQLVKPKQWNSVQEQRRSIYHPRHVWEEMRSEIARDEFIKFKGTDHADTWPQMDESGIIVVVDTKPSYLADQFIHLVGHGRNLSTDNMSYQRWEIVNPLKQSALANTKTPIDSDQDPRFNSNIGPYVSFNTIQISKANIKDI
tara:strand:+ start:1076 stop:1684 length:609 start_codon:yes stop_codon:yes gene_type:complete